MRGEHRSSVDEGWAQDDLAKPLEHNRAERVEETPLLPEAVAAENMERMVELVREMSEQEPATNKHETERRAPDALDRLLRAEQKRFLEITRQLDAGREQMLSEADRRTLKILSAGEIEDIEPAESGHSLVERCSILDRETEERVIGFRKRPENQLAARLNSIGDVETRSLTEKDGYKNWRWQKSKHPLAASMRVALLDQRHRTFASAASRIYGINHPTTESGLLLESEDGGDAIGVRETPPEFSIRAEVASSVIDSLTKFGVVPITSARAESKEGFSSIQAAINGQPAPVDATVQVLKRGQEHPAFKSFVRLGCAAWLKRESDGTAFNTYYDAAKQSFTEIDQSFNFGYSVRVNELGQAERNNLISSPLEILLVNKPEWRLDDEARAELNQLVTECDAAGYSIDAETEDSVDGVQTEPSLRAAMLRDCYRLLYERVDADGNVEPDSAKIAAFEMQEFIRRARYLAKEGHPPKEVTPFVTKTKYTAAIMDAYRTARDAEKKSSSHIVGNRVGEKPSVLKVIGNFFRDWLSS